MKAKLKFLVLITALLLIVAAAATASVYAQGASENTLPDWLTWQNLVAYAAIGGFFGFLHDFNDGNGVIIVPHKLTNGQWDLGIISPAIFGAVAGFVALAVTNVPFLNAMFPSIQISGAGSGILAAVFAGYFYSKTIQTLLSYAPGGQSSITASASPAATITSATNITLNPYQGWTNQIVNGWLQLTPPANLIPTVGQKASFNIIGYSVNTDFVTTIAKPYIDPIMANIGKPTPTPIVTPPQ